MDKENKEKLYSILLSVSDGDVIPEHAQKDILEMISHQEMSDPIVFSGDELHKIPFGLYEIFWKSGDSSLASVGNMYNGVRWVAPINWTSDNDPTGKMDKIAYSIDHMVLLYNNSNKDQLQILKNIFNK